MKHLLWLVFHVPGLKHPVYRVIVPVWNFVIASLEALIYLRKRANSLFVLRVMKDGIGAGAALSKWYADRGFKWNMDPMGGLLDFSSKPWVSIAKNHGDCDDMMLIAEAVLKGKYDEDHRCFLYSTEGKGHALYIMRQGERWSLMSNQRFFGSFDTAEDAARWFYKSDTRYVYIY